MSNTPSAPAAAPSAPAVAPASTPTTTSNSSAPSVGTTATTAVASKSPAEATTSEVKQPTSQEVKEAVKKWKLKAGKQEREVNSESELVRLAQLGMGAHEKFEQAAMTRKKAEEVLEIIQKNPAEALSKLGFDVRKLAEDFLAESIQQEMLTPEQKKLKDMETQLKKYQDEKAEFDKTQREQQISTLQTQYEVDIQANIIRAIDANRLPKNPKTVARFAEYMLQGVENGVDYDPKDLAPRIRRDLEEEHRHMYRDSGVEEILKILGEDTLKKIRQYELAKVKSNNANPTKTQQVANPVKEDNKPKVKKNLSDFIANLQNTTK